MASTAVSGGIARSRDYIPPPRCVHAWIRNQARIGSGHKYVRKHETDDGSYAEQKLLQHRPMASTLSTCPLQAKSRLSCSASTKIRFFDEESALAKMLWRKWACTIRHITDAEKPRARERLPGRAGAGSGGVTGNLHAFEQQCGLMQLKPTVCSLPLYNHNCAFHRQKQRHCAAFVAAVTLCDYVVAGWKHSGSLVKFRPSQALSTTKQ